MSVSVRLCSVEGCDRKLYSRGFCKKHYNRLKRNEQIEPKVFAKVCTVEGREKKVKARGFCDMHYWRVKRTGEAGKADSRYSDSLEEKFEASVDKNGPTMPHMDTPCWVWTAYIIKSGYGILNAEGEKLRAHCFSYERHYGVSVGKMHVLHRCDNPPCVRPDHLFLGTHQDNMADKQSKGRQPRGEKSGQAKLTARDVLGIRQMLAGGASQHATAEEYGVSRSCVLAIHLGNNWSWLKADS